MTGNNGKLKLLILSHSHELGGAELALFDLLDYFELKGLKLEPYFVVPATGEFVSKLEQKNWSYKVLNYGPWLWGDIPHHPEDIFRERMRNMQAVKTIQNLIKITQSQVVLTNTIVCPWAAIAASLESVPHIWYVHEYGDVDHGLKFEIGRKKTFEDIGLLSDLVVANSLAVAEHLASAIPKQKITTAYIPYNTKAVHDLAEQKTTSYFTSDDSIKLVFTGRIIGSKGQLEAVQAMANLKIAGVNAELCLVGGVQDEDYMDEIKKLIKQNKLGKSVHFTGHISNPYPIIKAADVGIVASRFEAYGRVTFEYMLLGKPVVGSASGGTIELVKDGENGFLYKAGDSSDLADQITKYVKNKNLIAQHSKKSQDIALQMLEGEYSASKLIAKINQLASTKSPQKMPNFIGELFDLPSIVKSYYGTHSVKHKSSLPVRALKKIYHKSPKSVRKATKPMIRKARKIKGNRV